MKAKKRKALDDEACAERKTKKGHKKTPGLEKPHDFSDAHLRTLKDISESQSGSVHETGTGRLQNENVLFPPLVNCKELYARIQLRE